jgi:hypothetical protein
VAASLNRKQTGKRAMTPGEKLTGMDRIDRIKTEGMKAQILNLRSKISNLKSKIFFILSLLSIPV